jgi:hypothetical protein
VNDNRHNILDQQNNIILINSIKINTKYYKLRRRRRRRRRRRISNYNKRVAQKTKLDLTQVYTKQRTHENRNTKSMKKGRTLL